MTADRLAGTKILLDTGLLVALHRADDRWHEAAVHWLRGFDGSFVTVEAVLVEVSFFLPARQRAALARMAAKGLIELHAPDAAGWRRIAMLMDKYADQDPDLADICLVWLAEATGLRRIVTLDDADFSVYRIHGRSSFERETWRSPAG